eukprot:10510439-Heterocapsa_arctica.AAC.1
MKLKKYKSFKRYTITKNQHRLKLYLKGTKITNSDEYQIDQLDDKEEAKKLQQIINRLGSSVQESLSTKEHGKASVKVTNEEVGNLKPFKVRKDSEFKGR